MQTNPTWLWTGAVALMAGCFTPADSRDGEGATVGSTSTPTTTQGPGSGPTGSGDDVDGSGGSVSSGGTTTSGATSSGTSQGEDTSTSGGAGNGESCSVNDDCANTCIDGSCADASSLSEPCDVGDDEDCDVDLDCGTEPFPFFDGDFEQDSARSACVSDDAFVTLTLTMTTQVGWDGNGLEIWCFGDLADNVMAGVPKTGDREFAGTAWAQPDRTSGGAHTVTMMCPRGAYVWGSCHENETGDTPQQITLFNDSGFQYSGIEAENTNLSGTSLRVFDGILSTLDAAIVCELETSP